VSSRSDPPLSPQGGLLRLLAADLARLQRLADPLLAAGLFQLFEGHRAVHADLLLLPTWVWVLAFTAILLPSEGIYASYRQRSLLTLARRLTGRWLLVVTALLLLTYATKTTAVFSRIDTSLWGLTTWVVLLLNHVGLRKLLRWHRQRGGNSRTILYWGTPEAAASFQEQLIEAPWMGLRLTAWFSPTPAEANTSTGLPACGGGLEEMRRWLAMNRVDRIVFSHLPRDEMTMDRLLSLFGDTCLPVVFAPQWARGAMRFRADRIGAIHCIDLWGAEGSLLDRQIKRVFDLLLTSVGVVLFSPLLLIIGCAVACTSPGPILFAQDRYGLDGRRFRIYKFRTMHVLEPGDRPGLRQATRSDPRFTAVGVFLRRWSLDELPQLINVLRGEMSLVGPRPHAVDHNEQYRRLISGYMQRHAFKPGITGLAQVEGLRGETSSLEAMERRVDADLRYQRDWSLKLDCKILLLTLLRLRSPQAY
jgi:putative colanic acid biosynthesis UDP-glucose lipid carrier transferase